MYKKIIIFNLILIMIGVIIFTMKEIVKGYCKETKCEYDVYTKEYLDSRFAVINGEITQQGESVSGNAYGSYANQIDDQTNNYKRFYSINVFDLPDGFTSENCIVLSVSINSYDWLDEFAGYNTYGNLGWVYRTYIDDVNKKINVRVDWDKHLQNSGLDRPVIDKLNIRIVLMKIS